MDHLTTLRALLAYGDEMNDRLIDAAMPLAPEQLAMPFDIGMRTLGTTLKHIYVAEAVWLERWKGHVETSWISLEAYEQPATLREVFPRVRADRDAFLDTLDVERLLGEQRYRDSGGSLFYATLHEMILQGIVHSTHHRAQAVHLLKRVGGRFVEVDFMYSRRRAVPGPG